MATKPGPAPSGDGSDHLATRRGPGAIPERARETGGMLDRPDRRQPHGAVRRVRRAAVPRRRPRAGPSDSGCPRNLWLGPCRRSTAREPDGPVRLRRRRAHGCDGDSGRSEQEPGPAGPRTPLQPPPIQSSPVRISGAPRTAPPMAAHPDRRAPGRHDGIPPSGAPPGVGQQGRRDHPASTHDCGEAAAGCWPGGARKSWAAASVR